MAVGRELARFRLDLVRVQEVIWDKGGGTLTEEDCSVFSVQKEWTSSVKDIGDSHHQLRLQNLLGTGCHIYMMGWDGSVGIATLFGLDGAGMESLWGARFSTLVQTGQGAHPASYTMGLSRGQIGRGGRSPPTPIQRRVLKKCSAMPVFSFWAFVVCFRVTFTFYLYIYIYTCM